MQTLLWSGVLAFATVVAVLVVLRLLNDRGIDPVARIAGVLMPPAMAPSSSAAAALPASSAAAATSATSAAA